MERALRPASEVGGERRLEKLSAAGGLKKTQGGGIQPIKQSFEADRLEQLPIIFFFLPPLLLLSQPPPPCVFLSPPRSLSSLGDRTDVNCARDRCASSLRNIGFFALQCHSNIILERVSMAVDSSFFNALRATVAWRDQTLAISAAYEHNLRPSRREAERMRPVRATPCRHAAPCV
jgi:hypothetical protein